MASIFRNNFDGLLETYSKYYSKMKTSIDYINSLRKNLGWDDKAYESKFRYLPKRYQKLFPKPEIHLRRFHEISVTNFRLTIVEPFLEELSKLERKKLGNIWVDMLPLVAPNARCFKVTNTNTPVIVIHDSMMGMLSFYAEFQYIYRKIITQNYDLADLFLNYSYQKLIDLFNMDEINLPIFKLHPDIKMATLIKASAQELFLVSHEFAHIILNHLEKCRFIELNFEDRKIKIEEYFFRQQLEFEADLQAVRWLLNFRKKALKTKILQFAVDLRMPLEIFALFHAIETNLKIESKTHPSSVDRLRYIFEELYDDLNSEEIEFIDGMFNSFNLGFEFKNPNLSKEGEEKLLLRINKML